jgi:nucleoside-triphosphatase THEP1
MSTHAVVVTGVEGATTLARALSKGARPVAAIVYDNEAYPDALFRQIVGACRGAEIAIAGVLQHLAFKGADRRCDVVLEDLSSGHRTQLFENRGSEARGCRLDGAALAEVTARIERSLAADGATVQPCLLVLNKFGKMEAEGEGMRGLIARALEAEIPVIIGVPARNLEAWREFAGDFSLELPADLAGVLRWLNSILMDEAR